MKLLGWMHRKFRQNGGDGFKDFPGGGTCNCLSGRPSLEEEHNRRRHQLNAFPSRSLRLPAAVEFVEEGGGGGGGREQAVEDLFGGLLAIGTLGIGTGPIEEEDTAVEEEEEAATPGFGAGATVEAITEKQAEATTETDLMVVSAELEKVLAAETEKATAAAGGGGDRLSSARPSHVSAGSSACPLQGFLFGSPIEIAETAPAAAGRRERRASLGELFMRSRMAEEGGGKREETSAAGGGVTAIGDGDGRSTAGMHLMKKLKRRGSRGSGGGPGEASAAETPFQKILQIFHRKVHPENSVAAKKTARSGKKNGGGNDFHGCGGAAIAASKSICRKEGTPNFKSCSNAPPLAISGSGSNANREHWIKTDADYLVLEL